MTGMINVCECYVSFIIYNCSKLIKYMKLMTYSERKSGLYFLSCHTETKMDLLLQIFIINKKWIVVCPTNKMEKKIPNCWKFPKFNRKIVERHHWEAIDFLLVEMALKH